jgi:hypothetical protein
MLNGYHRTIDYNAAKGNRSGMARINALVCLCQVINAPMASRPIGAWLQELTCQIRGVQWDPPSIYLCGDSRFRIKAHQERSRKEQ